VNVITIVNMSNLYESEVNINLLVLGVYLAGTNFLSLESGMLRFFEVDSLRDSFIF
jgi:hypothetical protein